MDKDDHAHAQTETNEERFERDLAALLAVDKAEIAALEAKRLKKIRKKSKT